MQLSNTKAIVTGANRGIGRVIAETLLEHGASTVYAAVRDIESAEELASAFGSRVIPVQLDLTDAETISCAAAKASDVNLVVNNAGVLRTSTALSEDAIENLKFEMEGNVYGLLRVAQAFAPVLKANGGGAFVQINSIVSMKCFPDFSTYCASKAAAYSITQALRTLWQEQGTQVISVHPGPILTDMGDAAGLTPVAEPPSLVADAILAAIESNQFHAFAGSMAEQLGGAYRAFATNVVEADLAEG
ncbi:MAG: SDR family oxidoreductase [Planctomycetota bacterium]